MNIQNAAPWSDARLCLLVGLAQGTLYRILLEVQVDSPGRAALVAGLATAALVAGMGLQQAWPPAAATLHGAPASIGATRPAGGNGRFLLGLGLLAAALAGCAAWVQWDQSWGTDAPLPDLGRDDREWSFLLWGLGALWCGISLAAAAGEARRSAGARLQWLRTTLHQGMAALAITGVVYLVLAAGVALLNLVGIDLDDVVFSEEGTVFLLPVCWGLGMYGLRRQPEAQASRMSIANLAGIAGRVDAGLARALLPVMAVLVGIFLVGLGVQGLEPLWSTRAAAAILLGMQGLVVAAAMLAAPSHDDGDVARAHEDANTANAEPSPAVSAVVRHSTDALLLALPILTALSAYALWLRIQPYGLTPERVHAVALCLLAVVAVGGLWLVVLRSRLKQRPWLEGAPAVAWAVAAAVVGGAVLMHTPVLDPLGLSARSQLARLLDGRVDVRNYSFDLLKNSLGLEGRTAAESFQVRLPELQAGGVYTAEQAAALAKAYAEALPYETRHDSRPPKELTAQDILALPEGVVAPPGLLDELVRTKGDGVLTNVAPLIVTPVQADADAAMEWLLIPSMGYWAAPLFDEQDGVWRRVGEYPVSLPRNELVEAANASGLGATPPAYYDLTVGEKRIPLRR